MQNGKSLTKQELIEILSRKSILSKKQIRQIVRQFLERVTFALQEGYPVKLPPFGVFFTRTRAARSGRHPKTGEPVVIPSIRVARFRPGKGLLDCLR